jgi:hypothetical protein
MSVRTVVGASLCAADPLEGKGKGMRRIGTKRNTNTICSGSPV